MSDRCDHCLRSEDELEGLELSIESVCEECADDGTATVIAELEAENVTLKSRIAELEDSLLDAAHARRAAPMPLDEVFAKADADGVQLKLDPAKLERLQAEIAAERAELEQQQAEREHLEEGARLLMGYMNGDAYEYDLDAWEQVELARKATSGGG